MRRTESGVPILSWCLSVRNCEGTIEACLKSLRERTPQAEIVVVDNMSRDKTPEIAKQYADVFVRYRGPKDNWTEDDPWTYDMAASREEAFKLASGRWRAWADSDDRIPGGEEAEKLLKLNNRFKPANLNVKHDDAKVIGLEELLLEVEKNTPDADCIWAPYLYAKDEHGQAQIWQERERIIKWSEPAKWFWSEAAHEILVPIAGYKPKYRIFFAHLLFVHEREHSDKNHLFAISRHFDVLHRQYEAGDRTTRRSIYLAAYAKDLCPEREREFIDDAHKHALTHADRYRVKSASAALYARQGLFNDAFEEMAAATMLRPDLPDIWIQGGEMFYLMEDYPHAIEWLEKALTLSPALGDSYANPRNHAIKYPTLLAMSYQKVAEQQKRVGLHIEAKCSLDRAADLAKQVKEHEAVGQDLEEAKSRYFRYDNERNAQGLAVSMAALGQYLLDNDEPQKAMLMLASKPWNLEDHPLLVDLEKKLRPVYRHVTDKEAYREFYRTDVDTGCLPSKEEWLDPDKAVPRVKWVANIINAFCPNAKILDVGCFDGMITIPLLKLCPGIKYVGVDIYQRSIDTLNERLKKYGFSDRAQGVLIKDLGELHDYKIFDKEIFTEGFDAALWFEVIEHVPDITDYLTKIASFVKPDGKVFISTPWGSFDGGHPAKDNATGGKRDNRNHLRVLTPRKMVEELGLVNSFSCADEHYVLEVEDLHHNPMADDVLGDAMHVMASKRKLPEELELPTTFVVPSALWDWNGRTLDAFGMGASEKSIVQTASALAAEYRPVEVYGPVPEETVYRGVPYWPLSQLRKVKEGKLVVSRSPSYAKRLDDAIGTKLPKILWLQDAWYNDLPDHWQDFEKIVVVSEWHKTAMHEGHGVPLERMEVIYNPVDARLYDAVGKVPRKNDHFVYCSSPDRGLVPLLKLWKELLKRLPNATLDIFYGFRGCQKLGLGNDSTWTKRYEGCRREFEQLRHQKGIVVRDMVSPVDLANTFISAGVWAYPVLNFNETCCTAAIEARASGCVPVCPPTAALAETAACPQGFLTVWGDDTLANDEQFIDACVKATQVSDGERAIMSKEAIDKYRIEKAVERWKSVLS